jgi:hypothetical protein
VTTGAARTTESWQADRASCMNRLERPARDACLSERGLPLLDKAKGLTQALLLTLQWFTTTCPLQVEALNLPPELEVLMHRHLIPAIDLDRVAQRSGQTEERQRLRRLSEELLQPLRHPDNPFATRDEAERRRVEDVAVECADLFQRSSSAVEGRNGQWSLHHHGQHRLSDRKLAAKTTRLDDQVSEAAIEQRKKEGYF